LTGEFLSQTQIVKCGGDVEEFRVKAKLLLTALLSRFVREREFATGSGWRLFLREYLTKRIRGAVEPTAPDWAARVGSYGIKGVYDITLKSAANAILQTDGPSLFTLIQELLGLKQVAAKDEIPILVIDHAEEPSED